MKEKTEVLVTGAAPGPVTQVPLLDPVLVEEEGSDVRLSDKRPPTKTRRNVILIIVAIAALISAISGLLKEVRGYIELIP